MVRLPFGLALNFRERVESEILALKALESLSIRGNVDPKVSEKDYYPMKLAAIKSTRTTLLADDKQLRGSDILPPSKPFIDLSAEEMSTPHQVRPVSLLSPQFINGVYIPSALLLVGCAIVKTDLLPFAIAIVLVLGGWKIYAASKQFALVSITGRRLY